jgi:DNA-binding SARP family transcriptional activator
LLVTAGHGTDGVIMVNLESLGALSVDGDPSGCEGVVRALALELATSHWTGWFDLNVVGFGVELERFERVVSLSDVSMLLDRLYRRRLNNESLLREAGYGSFAQARCADYSTRWDPVVVICSPTIAEADASELLELASDPRLGLAVVASGTTPGAPHVLSLAGAHRTSNLEPLGSVLFPQQIEPQELDSVTTLVDTAMSRQSVLISEEPYVNLPVSMPTTMSVQTPAPDEDVVAEPPRRAGGVGRTRGRQPDQASDMHEVEVAVLGQIEIFGAAREFTRAWSKELVVYLAMHPNGASNEAWATALWPDRLMAPSSLHSTASVARRALGQARNGIDHLPRSHGRLALSGTVGTDWDRFLVHADANDTGRWRTALELVRGRPFEGLRSSDWPILEGIGPAIEASIVDLSGRLAGSCLAAGDARGAEWAARRGLLVSPYDERLYRMLMRAADAGGNPAGVEAVMSELIKLVANEIEPLDSVHPSTMDLYRSLTRRRNGTARLLDPTFHAT